jgi:hypothetical protein
MRCRLSKIILTFLAVGAHLSHAQSVVQADPTAPLIPPDLRLVSDSQIAGITSVGDAFFPGPSPFVYGPYSLDPHFLYRFLYSTGLQVRPGLPKTSYIDSFAPGLGGDIGSHWTFDYTPTWTIYTSRAFRDSVDHAANIVGAYSQFNWDLHLTQSYDSSHQPLIETGEQTFTQTYLTNIDLTHHLNDAISIETDFSQTIRRIDPPPNSNEWDDTNWLHYRFSSGVDTSAGVGLGYLQQHPGSDSEYIQPQVQLLYPVGERISVSMHGGEEDREFLTHPKRRLLTPIYGGSVTYQPFQTTSVSLSANRSVEPSFFANQITTSTSWNISLQQRLLEHFLLSATAGYVKSTYLSETDALNVDRDDNAQMYGLRLSTTFLRRGTLTVLYNRTQNSSSQTGFGFSSSQLGFEVGFRY